MSGYLFDTPKIQSIPVKGEAAEYPINRIFCVGRNYAAHAAEMGGEVDREAPWYFIKSPSAYVASHATVPYPPGTANFHYEMELALGLGAPVFRADAAEASAAIYGYGCALDMTRRDRQQDGKDHRRPWDLGKDIENGAVMAPLTRASDWQPMGQRIHLAVNGEIKQDASLEDMVWTVAEIVSHLSGFYHLIPGDVIMTGTPAGVGPVVAGDKITGGIDGLDPIALTLSDPE
ncbi:Fumarylpyruvate hydrolase [Thalassovita gelatinovora]|uniref:Fumarylpyruvate hydrolase n=1 Tax=Thalassovita gelatinovora TaxID=53501 RepID=A0A0P1FKB0_THAGE|nr:fumarylacetoacetate hydrolase family protein [Thalassovita gelatinovora]QIZ82387.1 fumarylacetoacetate hydrolase family protein [Thalassovita gelatinovora]CUH68464.1 Fumarylpyruvate hydrolase [Thalassovita gelatinovora]SEQ52730.1 fumarylpyruvate hydrolase [Thalassovita gelatinovora]